MQNKKFLKATLLSMALTLGAAQAETVVLYSSNNPETIQAAVDVVKQKTPGLDVQTVTGGTGTMMKRIEAEAANPRGDLFWSGGFGTLGSYSSQLQPYTPDGLDAIPERFRGPDNLWVGTNVHLMVIMVNKRQLRGLPEPTTWSDLMKPEWKGKFAITDPAKSGTTYLLVYGLYKQFGQEGLDKIAANAVVTGSSGTTYKGVGNGEYAAGLTLEYAAKTLYDGLMSKEVQEALLVKNFRRPVREDIDVSALTDLPAMKDVKVYEFDQGEAAADYEKVVAAWNEAVAKGK